MTSAGPLFFEPNKLNELAISRIYATIIHKNTGRLLSTVKSQLPEASTSPANLTSVVPLNLNFSL
jgi:hypothetical protein